MRRLIAVSLMALSLAGCKRQAETAESTATEATKDAPLILKTAFNVGDEQASAYILHGFHGLEENQWRWVGSKFGVNLGEPEGAKDNGARLELKFAYPDAAAKKLGPLTLSATVNGQPILSETYQAAGKYTFTRDLAGPAFHGGPVTLEFTTDKALPGSSSDVRELALIVTDVSLSPR